MAGKAAEFEIIFTLKITKILTVFQPVPLREHQLLPAHRITAGSLKMLIAGGRTLPQQPQFQFYTLIL
jgi:hypothetical protein